MIQAQQLHAPYRSLLQNLYKKQWKRHPMNIQIIKSRMTENPNHLFYRLVISLAQNKVHEVDVHATIVCKEDPSKTPKRVHINQLKKFFCPEQPMVVEAIQRKPKSCLNRSLYVKPEDRDEPLTTLLLKSINKGPSDPLFF
uniref:Uncharacterized protein n=1 Tax=Ditylenchus dipsaci TaxID=166011 RepID=A0A915DI94_9BILA